MQRILVIGSSGSGKSTFSLRLGAITGLPIVHIDQLYWGAGWVPVPTEVYRQRMHDAIASERWIMDGNSPNTLDLRLPRADKVILFNRSRLACLARIARSIARTYGKVRPDMAEGCPVKVDWEFIKYVWNWAQKDWPPVTGAIDRNAAWERTVTLTSDAASAAFLDAVQAQRPTKLNAT